MKHKKGVAFYVFLGIVFSIVYIILAAEPLAKEHQFSATMAVQIALRKLGYQSGKVDGIL